VIDEEIGDDDEPTHAGGAVVRGEKRREYLIATSSSGVGWVLPKGMIDPGETPEEAALREVAEEAAVACEIVAPLGDVDIEKLGRVSRTRFFLMRVITHLPKTEERDLLFVDADTAKQMLSAEGAREIIDRAEAYLAQRD
jgi:8-oxo-dGTP pyrophosphatase MutT (NUDIX family)